MLSGVLQRTENPDFSAFPSAPHWNTEQPHRQRRVGSRSAVSPPILWESNAPTKEHLGSKERRRQGWKSSLFILSRSWVCTSAPDQSTRHLRTHGHKMDQSWCWCCPFLGALASSEEESVSSRVLEETSPSHSSCGKSACIQLCLECGNFNAQEPLLTMSRELPSAAPGDIIIFTWLVWCQHGPACPQGFRVLWALGTILASLQLVGIPWGSCSRSVNPHKPIIHVRPLSLMPFPISW